MAQSGSILGNSVLRKEDPGLLTGANEYFDDLKAALQTVRAEGAKTSRLAATY